MPTLAAYKPAPEIEASLENVRRLFVLTCGVCAALWWEHSAEARRRLDRYLAERGIEVTGHHLAFCPCVPYAVEARLGRFRKEVERADAIGMVSCPLGVAAAYLVTRRTKPVIPFLDSQAITCCSYYNEEGNPVVTPCSGCGSCVLGITDGICTVENCVLGLRVPCRREKEIVRQCREDPSRDCPFFFIRERGRLADLLSHERRLRERSRAGIRPGPAVEVTRPLAGRRRWVKRLIASAFTRLSMPFAVLTAVTEQPPPRKVRF